MPYANMLSLIKSYSYIYICMFVIYFYHDYDYDYLSRGVKECLILSFFPVGAKGSLPTLKYVVWEVILNLNLSRRKDLGTLPWG